MTPDPYATLGVAPDADPVTIRAAYRRQALEQHPDHGGSTAAMAQVNLAYAALRDPARRAALDGAPGTGSDRRSSRGPSRTRGPTPRPARGWERPPATTPRRDPGRRTLRSPRLASRLGQWVATLAALAGLGIVGLIGGSDAVSAAAALLVLIVVADRRPVGVPYWPALDVREALAMAVRRGTSPR